MPRAEMLRREIEACLEMRRDEARDLLLAQLIAERQEAKAMHQMHCLMRAQAAFAAAFGHDQEEYLA